MMPSSKYIFNCDIARVDSIPAKSVRCHVLHFRRWFVIFFFITLFLGGGAVIFLPEYFQNNPNPMTQPVPVTREFVPYGEKSVGVDSAPQNDKIPTAENLDETLDFAVQQTLERAAKQPVDAVATKANEHTKKEEGKMARVPATNKHKPIKEKIHVPPQLAMALYRQGIEFLMQKKVTLAIQSFTQCIDVDVDYAQAYRGLGDSYQLLGRTKTAVEAYERYLALAPNDRDAGRITSLLDAYYEQNKAQ